MLVASAHELEEQHCSALADGDVADFVDDHQRWMSQYRKPALEVSIGLCLFEPGNKICERAVVDPAPEFGRSNREANGQVCLAHPWRPEKHHVFLSFQESELCETLNLLALDGRLERKVELLE